MLFTVATPTTGFVSEYPEIVLWILGVLFAAVVMFISSWMTRHDKARDEMSAKLHDFDKQLVEVKATHEFMREAITDLKESSASILEMVRDMHRTIREREKEGGQ